MLGSAQDMVPVKELADMELARNRALDTILINSTLKINPLPYPIPQVPSPNSPNTPVGSLLDSVIHLARLASAAAISRVSEQQVPVLVRLRPVTAKMLPHMARRALTLAALVARASSSPRADMALPRLLLKRIPSLAQAKALHPALLKAKALNRASAVTANLPKAAMAQQLAATDLIEDRSEFYIQNIQQDHELNLS